MNAWQGFDRGTDLYLLNTIELAIEGIALINHRVALVQYMRQLFV